MALSGLNVPARVTNKNNQLNYRTMKKITREIVAAFMNRECKRIGNSQTDGKALYLHENPIAVHLSEGINITAAGWNTPTTWERLNGLPGVKVYVRDHQLYLNDRPWDGSWTEVR